MAVPDAYTVEEIEPLSPGINKHRTESDQKETEQTIAENPIEDDETMPLRENKEHDIIINIHDGNSLNPNDLGDITLISRAHSDPLSLTSKTSKTNHPNMGENDTNSSNVNPKRDSIFLSNNKSSKKYASEDDIRDPKRVGDFQGFSIREASVEMLAIRKDRDGQEKKEEIVVPARDNLVKMPFFTTPLTLEATHHAFFDFRERLIEMGFDQEAEAALVHTQCESVEEAVSFIFTNDTAIFHRFVNANIKPIGLRSIDEELEEEDSRKTDGNKLCKQCKHPLKEHLIDENGKKVATDLGISDIIDNISDLSRSIPEANTFDDKAGSIPDILEAKHEESDAIVTQMSSLEIHEIIKKTEESIPATTVYDGPTEECLICFDPKPSDYFTDTECGHNKYCKECLTAHYKVKIKDGDVLKVKCIDHKCEREIGEEEILNFLTDDEVREKFHKFKRQKLLMLNENARFCPTADCEGYMIGSRLKPKLTCAECKTVICFNCSKLWHGYFTKCSSAQNAQEDDYDAKFFEWEAEKKEGVKKCPKCKIRIEKNEGCNHMTCYSCKYEFCWICRGKYDGNHFSQWNIFGCPGAQYSRGQMCSIQRCPDCFPMWLRRLLIIIAFLLLLPIILAFGIIAGCVYGCAICVVFTFDKFCCCDC